MQFNKQSRFKIVSKQVPGIDRFSFQIFELNKDGSIKKKRKTCKERRRVRNRFKKLKPPKEVKKIEDSQTKCRVAVSNTRRIKTNRNCS